jgi:hypothetical protein
LCDIFEGGSGNCTFRVGLSNRFARSLGTTTPFAVLSRLAS